MRHQYTCIFSEVLTSRMWAQPTATRAVWLWFQLSADPEGFVPATTSGVAIGAHVTESEAREALSFLESQDIEVDAEDDPWLGQVLERVPRGWRVIGFEADRARAKREGEKARNRRYMAARRAADKAAANDTERPPEPVSVVPVTPDPTKMDVPKPIPKPKPKPSSSEGGDLPLPPAAEGAQGAYLSNPASWQPVPKVITQIPADFELDAELRMAAKLAGVRDPDASLAKLRQGPIGGNRGIFASELRAYIRDTCIPKWRQIEEAERFKGGKFPGNTPTPEAAPAPRVKGMPPWVYESHKVCCDLYELDLKAEAKAFAKSHHIPPKNLQPNDAAQAFTEYLLKRAREAA